MSNPAAPLARDPGGDGSALTPACTHSPASSPLSGWLAGLIISGAFVLAAALSWRKWADCLIDFGLQLYLPWRISQGAVLYHDMAYLTAGPLSQYYHAALFKIFGVSYRVIIFSNLLLTAGFLVLLFRCVRAAAGIAAATLVCLVICLVFAFNQYGDIGNYNFISPYCHETVHGVMLSTLALALLARWIRKDSVASVCAAGFCSGLVFLTKPEVFAALALAVAATFLLRVKAGPSPACRFLARSFAAFLLAAPLPFLGFMLYFRQFESWAGSIRSAGFAWTPVFHGGVAGGYFYRWCLGLDEPGRHLASMFKQLLVLGAVLGIFTFVFRRDLRSSLNRLLAIAVVAVALGGASAFDWTDSGRTLPCLDAAFCLLLCARFWRGHRRDPAVLLIIWSVFGFFLTAKLGLFCRIWHYGFILAMPAAVSAVLLLVWLLPSLLAKSAGVNLRLFRGAITLLLLLGSARLFVQSQLIYREKTALLGTGGDEMFGPSPKINPACAALQTAVTWLEKNTPANSTLAVMPEGVMVNYLTRRPNPAGYLVWNPVEMAMFGQQRMTESFESHPPDYVMLVQRDASEYGAKPFGQQPGFGLDLMQWVRAHYQEVALIGEEPLQKSAGFGISILERPKTGAEPLQKPGASAK